MALCTPTNRHALPARTRVEKAQRPTYMYPATQGSGPVKLDSRVYPEPWQSLARCARRPPAAPVGSV